MRFVEAQAAINLAACLYMPWPHAPMHQLGSTGMYFVTASTLHQAHHFKGKERLAVLHRGVLKVAANFGWRLEAWAVFFESLPFCSPIAGAGRQCEEPRANAQPAS